MTVKEVKIIEQGGRDADRIESLSLVLMVGVARPQYLESHVQRATDSYRRQDDPPSTAALSRNGRNGGEPF